MAGRFLLRTLPKLSATGTSLCRPTVGRALHASSALKYPVTSRQVCFSKPFSSAAEKFECINIQDSTDFQKQVLDNATPVVVDFHATWCGPCKLLGPRLESIIGAKSGKVILAKVDVDDNPELAMKYGVRSVPTVLGVKKGEVADQFIGCQEDDQIDSFVEKLLIN